VVLRDREGFIIEAAFSGRRRVNFPDKTVYTNFPIEYIFPIKKMPLRFPARNTAA